MSQWIINMLMSWLHFFILAGCGLLIVCFTCLLRDWIFSILDKKEEDEEAAMRDELSKFRRKKSDNGKYLTESTANIRKSHPKSWVDV